MKARNGVRSRHGPVFYNTPDLLTALEAMDERLTFVRRPIPDWPGIWLLPATSSFYIVGGGITILESRTLDDSGQRTIAFTSGHIAFRQSLLVRLQDAERLASYANLTSDVRVGDLRGTTGEAPLLQITGLADGEGVLARDTRIENPGGTVVANGTARYTITAATVSAGLEGRTRIDPAFRGEAASRLPRRRGVIVRLARRHHRRRRPWRRVASELRRDTHVRAPVPRWRDNG